MPVDELRSFGLSAYEADAYTALLALGTADAATVSRRAGIPFGRVYDVLHGLVGRGLAQVREGRPKLFAPAPPREALEELLAARRRELAEEADRLGKISAGLGEELQRVGQGAPLRGGHYQVTLGRAEARRALAQVVGDAKRTLLASLEFERYDPADHVVFEAIQGAAERGVDIRALLRPQDVRLILQSEYAEPIGRYVLPYLGENLDVRVSDKAQVPFSVTDAERVTLAVRDPGHPEQHFAVVVFRDPRVAADLRAKFEALWGEAPGLWDVLEATAGGATTLP